MTANTSLTFSDEQKRNILDAQYKKAVTEGDTSMLIHLGQTVLGQTKELRVTTNTVPILATQLTRDQILEMLAEQVGVTIEGEFQVVEEQDATPALTDQRLPASRGGLERVQPESEKVKTPNRNRAGVAFAPPSDQPPIFENAAYSDSSNSSTTPEFEDSSEDPDTTTADTDSSNTLQEPLAASRTGDLSQPATDALPTYGAGQRKALKAKLKEQGLTINGKKDPTFKKGRTAWNRGAKMPFKKRNRNKNKKKGPVNPYTDEHNQT